MAKEETPTTPPKKRGSTRATAAEETVVQPTQGDSALPLVSMILGIIAIITFIFPVGIAALVLGIMGLKKYPHINRGFSITGIITGAASIVLSLLFGIFLAFLVIAGAFNEENWYDEAPGTGDSHYRYQSDDMSRSLEGA